MVLQRGVLGLVLAAFVGLAHADEPAPNSQAALGQAVHAYNTGSFQEAFDHLTVAIQAKSDDPRVYFYRGLALLELGQSEEAGKLFAIGARLEAGDSVGVYNVNRALERVQGPGRIMIESLRKVAKAEAIKKREAAREARRAQLERNEERVIAKPRPGTPDPKDPLGEPPTNEAPTIPDNTKPEKAEPEKPQPENPEKPADSDTPAADDADQR